MACCWLKQLRKTFFILLVLPTTNRYSHFVSVYASKSFHSLPQPNYTSNQHAGFALHAGRRASTRRYCKLQSPTAIPYTTLPLSSVSAAKATDTSHPGAVLVCSGPVLHSWLSGEDSEWETSAPLSFVFTKPGLKSSLAQRCKLERDSCNYFFTKSPTVDAAVSVRDIFFYRYKLFNIYNRYKVLLADCFATLKNITKGTILPSKT